MSSNSASHPGQASSSSPQMRTVNVSLGKRSYPIHIGEGILSELGAHCAALELGKRCAVISDTQVAKRYAKATLASLKKAGFETVLVTFSPGETSKSIKVVE